MHKINPGAAQRSNPATWDPKDVFTGTARFYVKYRPGYPKRVIQTLVDRFDLNNRSIVIDLGCGPGSVTLKLAPHVEEIIAIDPQEEMLEVARSAALARPLDNIRWVNGESADILSLVKPEDGISLTVIARAFHWMAREQTLEDLYRITSPGGGIAIIVDNGPMDGQELPWKKVIKDTVRKWLGEERKAGTTGTYTYPEKPFEEFLEESEFENLRIVKLKSERTWSIDRIVGYVYSTSFVSLPVLGDKKELFESDLRQKLTEHNPNGKFKERVITQIMMAWKK